MGGETARCRGYCGRTLPVDQFGTFKNGKRKKLCDDCLAKSEYRERMAGIRAQTMAQRRAQAEERKAAREIAQAADREARLKEQEARREAERTEEERVILAGGRYCKPCHKYHLPEAFDGDNKTCREFIAYLLAHKKTPRGRITERRSKRSLFGRVRKTSHRNKITEPGGGGRLSPATVAVLDNDVCPILGVRIEAQSMAANGKATDHVHVNEDRSGPIRGVISQSANKGIGCLGDHGEEAERAAIKAHLWMRLHRELNSTVSDLRKNADDLNHVADEVFRAVEAVIGPYVASRKESAA